MKNPDFTIEELTVIAALAHVAYPFRIGAGEARHARFAVVCAEVEEKLIAKRIFGTACDKSHCSMTYLGGRIPCMNISSHHRGATIYPPYDTGERSPFLQDPPCDKESLIRDHDRMLQLVVERNRAFTGKPDFTIDELAAIKSLVGSAYVVSSGNLKVVKHTRFAVVCGDIDEKICGVAYDSQRGRVTYFGGTIRLPKVTHYDPCVTSFPLIDYSPIEEWDCDFRISSVSG